MTDSSGSTRVRLETWGEIAAHLGIEIRTAQRWELRLGLPVRRLAGGQAVYAYVDDLDAWRAARERRGGHYISPRGALQADEAGLTRPVGLNASQERGDAAPSSEDASAWWARLRVRWAALLLAGGVLVAGTLARWPGMPAGPASIAMLGSTLVALDPQGSRVWSHDLDTGVRPVDISPRRPGLTDWWERIDIDGDGVDEFLVLVDGLGGRDDPSESVLGFTLGGRMLFAYTPDVTLRFRDGTFSGPWDIFDVEAVPGNGLWVAFAHVPWWPSGILRLDIAGRATLHYVQPGTVRLLRAVAVDGRTRVIAAGVNNEYASASVALIDPHGTAATAPQDGRGRFACLACPTGLPEAYLLLLRSPANRLSPYPYNGIVGLVGGTVLQLTSQEAVPSANVMWRVSPTLEVQDARPTDSYWTWRPEGRTESPWPGGRGHPAEAPYRIWRAGRWVNRTVPYGGAPPQASVDTANEPSR